MKNKKQILKKLSVLSVLLFGLFIYSDSVFGTTCPNAQIIPSNQTFPSTAISLVCGTTNDLTGTNTAACGSALYKGGQEALFVYTPSTNISNFSVAYTGVSWTGIFIYEGCPSSGGLCLTNITSSATAKNTSANPLSLTANVSYYIWIDTYPSPVSPCPGTITLSGIIPPACSGTPAPGNTIASNSSVCAGSNTSLSLQNNYANFSNITYQWESFDGTNWNPISGATASVYNAIGLTAQTQFRCQVTCSGTLTAASMPITISVNTIPSISLNETNIALCTLSSASLIANGGVSYSWSPATGLSATTGAAVSASPLAATTYTVTGTDANNCSSTAIVSVNPIVSMNLISSSNPSLICQSGNQVTLDVQSLPTTIIGATTGGTWEYQWLDDNSNVLQAWSAVSAYNIASAPAGLHEFYVSARSTSCPSSPSADKLVNLSVGFGGNINTTNINCINTSGAFNIADAFGQGEVGTWYNNNFTSNNLVASQAFTSDGANFNGGRMVLTNSAASQKGGFTILNPNGISGINTELEITFKLTADQPINNFGTGGGDGVAYSFGNNADYSTTGSQCNGNGDKLRITFDAANNGASNGNVAGIYLVYGYTGGTTPMGPASAGTLAHSTNMSWKTATDTPVKILITADGKVTLTLGGVVIFNQIQLPAAYAAADKSTWKHVFSAHTGGDALRQAIDDLNIKYTKLDFGYSSTGTGWPTNWQNGSYFSNVAAGTYDVYMANPIDSTCNMVVGTVTITDATPNVDLGNSIVGCNGDSVVLDAQNPGLFYNWNNLSISQTQTVTQSGTYWVTVTDADGCTDSDTVDVNFIDYPIVDLGSNITACANQTINLDAGNAGLSFNWSNGATTQTISPITSGTYWVTVSNNGSCSSSDTVSVNLLALATASSVSEIVTGFNADFTVNNPQNVTSYFWNFGDGSTLNGTSPNAQHTYANGTYSMYVVINNNNGCDADTLKTTVLVSDDTSINEEQLNNAIQVYPNPTNGLIQIQNNLNKAINQVVVYDYTGKEVFSNSINSNKLSLDISDLPQGIYFIKAIVNEQFAIKKIVKY